MGRRAIGTVCACAALLAPSPAASQPQWNVGVQPGVAGVGADGSYWQQTRFHGALHGDVLLGRDRDSDFGVGPYLDLGTVSFSDVRLGGGGSVLLPVSTLLPLVVSAGGYGRRSEAGWDPGLAASLFWGLRGHNFHGRYSAAGGICLGLQQGLGARRDSAIVVAAHVDALLLVLPFVVGVEWLRH